jgi:hypothetical protein
MENLASIKSRNNKVGLLGFILLPVKIMVLTMILTACAQPAAQHTPIPQPSLKPTMAATGDPMIPVVSAAKSVLGQELKIGIDAIQLVKVQPTQWPDSCLGVPKPGVMCAMNVVDGYRINLSVHGQTYEIHSNLDGEQIVILPGAIPTPAG